MVSMMGADMTTRVVSTLLGLAVVTTWVVWAANDGGFAPQQWIPGALTILGLLAVLLVSQPARQGLRQARGPAALFGLYVLWSYLSILWAQVPGDALDGANRTFLYWIVFAFFVSAPLTERARVALIGAWACSIVAVGAVDFARASSAAGPRGFFILGRFASPITYPNANAALFLMAFLPLQVIASQRGRHPAVRAVATSVSCLALELALLGQSRGSLIALPLAVVVYLALSRNVLRTLPSLLIVAAAAGPAVPDLLHVFTAVVDGDGYAASLRHARDDIAIGVFASGVAAFAVAFVDRRFRVPPKTCVLLRRTIFGLVATAAIASAIAAAVLTDPAARARHAWASFKGNESASPETIHIASGVGTSRYDVWRIAFHQFTAHPIGGVGADNYLVGYLRARRTVETARYPESIELRALSETGIVGSALFFCFLGLSLRRAVRAARAEAPAVAPLAALVATSYWLLHASVDWLWEFPALAAPALGLLALAAAASSRAAVARAPSVTSTRRSAPERWIAAAAVGTALAGAAALTTAWISVRQIDQAFAVATHPDRAYRLLDSAARWNPLSEQPALAEATIAANTLDRRHEQSALRSALRRNPSDWYAHLMLGIVAGRENRLAAARAELVRARRLSPLEPVVIYAQRNLNVGNPLDERDIGEVFRIRSRTLRGAAQR
jgi:O-antigen ligase